VEKGNHIVFLSEVIILVQLKILHQVGPKHALKSSFLKSKHSYPSTINTPPINMVVLMYEPNDKTTPITWLPKSSAKNLIIQNIVILDQSLFSFDTFLKGDLASHRNYMGKIKTMQLYMANLMIVFALFNDFIQLIHLSIINYIIIIFIFRILNFKYFILLININNMPL
jgi:hypothetical protein